MSRLDRLHAQAVRSPWLQRFTAFTRVLLAVGFLEAGSRKVGGEPFGGDDLGLPYNAFLEAFYQARVLYAFVGWTQIASALLLLWPRTALLGVVIYTPVILNVVLINLSIDFGGTLQVTLLMLLACAYLLCWDWPRIRALFPRREPRRAGFEMREVAGWAAASGIGAALVGALTAGAGYGWDGLWDRLSVPWLAVIAALGVPFGLLVAWHVRQMPGAPAPDPLAAGEPHVTETVAPGLRPGHR